MPAVPRACLRPSLLLAALALAGCATRAPAPAKPDSPEARPPPELMQVPDAAPVLEPIRAGGPNKPYEVLGETYTPLPAEAALSERGLASWYGRKFHGRRTASGELYNMYAMSAAHRTLPLPSFARVSNPANGRSVVVRVNDRGPFVKGRIVDLSYTAAQRLGVFGLATVDLVRITPDEIRRGTWQLPAASAAVPLIDGDEPPTAAVPGPAYWIQLGAFRDRKGAERMQGQASSAVDGIAPLLAVFSEGTIHRLQAGPFADREEAQRWAARLRESLTLAPMLVERR